jgi:hypothetical protein
MYVAALGDPVRVDGLDAERQQVDLASVDAGDLAKSPVPLARKPSDSWCLPQGK